MGGVGRIDRETWLAWLGATGVAAVTMTFVLVTFVYANFETKDHAKEQRDATDKRLERIEDKMDALLENRPYRGPARDR